MLKQELYSEDSIYNLIDFLIQKKCKRIFINFSYFDDNEKPSISIGSFGKSISMEEFNQILLHPDISKRESKEYYPFINSCFNLSKKVSFFGRNGSENFSLAFENQGLPSPYLDYKKVSKPKENIELHDNEFTLIKFEDLENISFKNNSNVDSRKPHMAFYNLLNTIDTNIFIKYYKMINDGLEFYTSARSTSEFCKLTLMAINEGLSPFQEHDTQCQELEETHKIFKDIAVKVKPFLISYENNPDVIENSKMHGVHYMHQNKIVHFDQWSNTFIKKRRISAKDPNKIIRIRVLLEGDIQFGNIFSINPLTNKIKISYELIKMIDLQIEKALSASLVLTQNITDEDELELENIARSDALAAYRELVYSKRYSKEKAIRKICDQGEMVKYSFIEDYLREAEV